MYTPMSLEHTARRIKPPSPRCFACGPENPIGLRLHFEEKDGGVEALFKPTRDHEGWTGLIHGGIVSTLLDEAMAYALYFAGLAGLTARMEARFRRAIAPGEELRVCARITDARRGVVDAEAFLTRSDGVVVAEATARFMSLERASAPSPTT